MKKFLSLLLVALLPSLLILYFYSLQEEKRREKSHELQQKQVDLLRKWAICKENIALHKACKGKVGDLHLLSIPFVEGKIEKHALFQEVEVVQKTQATLSAQELKKLLALIEGADGPQMIVQDFTLEREEDNRFAIQTKLLMREFP